MDATGAMRVMPSRSGTTQTICRRFGQNKTTIDFCSESVSPIKLLFDVFHSKWTSVSCTETDISGWTVSPKATRESNCDSICHSTGVGQGRFGEIFSDFDRRASTQWALLVQATCTFCICLCIWLCCSVSVVFLLSLMDLFFPGINP